jgi:hypothetical protein
LLDQFSGFNLLADKGFLGKGCQADKESEIDIIMGEARILR